MNIVVRCLGLALSLNFRDAIRSPHVLNGSHLMTFILSCTVLEPQITVREVVDVQPAAVLILLGSSSVFQRPSKRIEPSSSLISPCGAVCRVGVVLSKPAEWPSKTTRSHPFVRQAPAESRSSSLIRSISVVRRFIKPSESRSFAWLITGQPQARPHSSHIDCENLCYPRPSFHGPSRVCATAQFQYAKAAQPMIAIALWLWCVEAWGGYPPTVQKGNTMKMQLLLAGWVISRPNPVHLRPSHLLYRIIAWSLERKIVGHLCFGVSHPTLWRIQLAPVYGYSCSRRNLHGRPCGRTIRQTTLIRAKPRSQTIGSLTGTPYSLGRRAHERYRASFCQKRDSWGCFLVVNSSKMWFSHHTVHAASLTDAFLIANNQDDSGLLRWMHTGVCMRCPLLRLRNFPNRNPETYIAIALTKTGYRNWFGCDQMIVDTYESSSKVFWNEASVEENEPRWLPCTSFNSIRWPSNKSSRAVQTSWTMNWAHKS